MDVESNICKSFKFIYMKNNQTLDTDVQKILDTNILIFYDSSAVNIENQIRRRI
jgi:hypothetical protein